jgi:hypothetical protein
MFLQNEVSLLRRLQCGCVKPHPGNHIVAFTEAVQIESGYTFDWLKLLIQNLQLSQMPSGIRALEIMK